MKNKKKQTQISEIGEFGLIDKIQKSTQNNNNLTRKGIGDDAAVVSPRTADEILISSDLLIEGIHFDCSYMSLAHVGYKSIMVNLSDIYAMNAKPSQITVSLAISNRYTVEDIEELYKGINMAAKKHEVNVVGGDISSSYSGLTISVSVIGFQSKDKIVYREGAKDGDSIVVSGNIGAAYLGLRVLEREKQLLIEHKIPKLALPEIEEKLSEYRYLVERQIKPEAQKKVIKLLHDNKIKPTAMIDVSDGLVPDLNHLAKQSNSGYSIYEKRLPIHKQTIETSHEFKISPMFAALYGGEDYELLFTVNKKEIKKIKETKGLTIIGEIIKRKKNNIFDINNTKIDLKEKGWGHFNI